MVLLRFQVALCVAALWFARARLVLGCAALLCRSCGHEVAEAADLRFVPSPLALSHRNDTVIGGKRVSAQLFENPQGFRFEVVTVARADVLKRWPADGHFSWYPGHAWTVASCPRCQTQLGWAFQPSDWPGTVKREEFEGSDRTFVALILDQILQEHFASQLLMTPKSFRS